MPRKKTEPKIIRKPKKLELDVINAKLENPLTMLAVKFVKEYVYSDDMNQTKAAIRAGYSPRSAPDIANKLRQDPRVQELIRQHLDNLFGDIELRKKFLLRRMFEIVTSDITNYIEIQNVEYEKGKQILTISHLHLKDIFQLPPAQRQLIKSISQGKNGIKIELEDKIAASNFIAKHLKMFGEDDEPKGDTTNNMQVNIYMPNNGRDENK